MYIDIRCPNCFAEIKAKYLNIKNEDATCPKCSTHFSLKKTIQKDLRKKVHISQPARFQVLNVGNIELDIQYEFQYKSSIATYFSLLLLSRFTGSLISISIFLIFAVTFTGVFWGYILTFVLIAIALIAFQVFKISNNIKATINIKDQILNIKNPSFNLKSQIKKRVKIFLPETNIQIESNKIDQIYIEETTTKKGKVIELYILKFKLKDGTEVAPILPLLDLKEALFIEQELEKYLGIVDRTMPNEYKT